MKVRQPGKRQCEAILQMADDEGDNTVTFHCQLPQRHEGPHREEGKLYNQFPYCITWEKDMTPHKVSREEVEKYLSLPYEIHLERDNDGIYYIYVEELPGCATWAETLEEAQQGIREAMEGWIESNLERGLEIPLPKAYEKT